MSLSWKDLEVSSYARCECKILRKTLAQHPPQPFFVAFHPLQCHDIKDTIANDFKRRSDEYNAKKVVDDGSQTFREQDSIRQQQLDERVEDLQARFSDIDYALQFDANRIDRKLATVIFKGETQPPCLGSRTKVAICFQDAKGSNCDDYVKELERCVKETVVFKNQ